MTKVADTAWRRLRGLDPGFGLSVLLAIFVVWPMLPPGLPHTADVALHVNRTIQLDQLWREGIFYQRWAPDLALGYGYPLFNFYAPLYYYLSESAHFVLGLDYATSLSTITSLAICLHGLGMYGFLRGVVGPRGALLGAAAYIYAPVGFRWLFIAGTYPQFLAHALLPLALWAFRELTTSGRRAYLAPAAVSLAAIVLSHNLTGLLFLPFLGAYLLLLTWASRASVPKQPSRSWLTGPALSVVALLLAGGLSAFYWFPALYDLRWVQSSGLVTGYFQFNNHYLTLQELFAPSVPIDIGGHNPYVPFNLGLAQALLALLGLVVSAVCFVRRRMASTLQAAHAGFFLVVMLGSVFLMLPVSEGVYEVTPLMRYVQFPWRLLGLAALGTAGLTAISLNAWPVRWRDATLIVLAVALVMEAFVFTYPATPFRRFDDVTVADAVADEDLSGTIGTTSGNDYLPIWVTRFPRNSPLLAAYASGKAPERLDFAGVPAATRVTAASASPAGMTYQVEGTEPFSARFFQFYFPGWTAELDGKPVALVPQEETGFATVSVPAGKHVLSVAWQELPHRLAADAVSLGSLLILALVALVAPLRHTLAGAPLTAVCGPAAMSWRTAARMAAVVSLLFAAKVGWVDPRTDLFRTQSPPGQVLGCPHPTRVEMEGTAALTCHDANDRTVLAGETLRVTTYWQALAKLDRPYGTFVELVSADGRVWAASRNDTPGDIPATGWFRSLYVRDVHELTLPVDAPPVVYSLRTGLFESAGGRRLAVVSREGADAVALASVRLKGARPPDRRDLPAVPVGRFGECISLVAYRWNSSGVAAGRSASVTLYWRAECPPDGDYTVTAQLLDSDNRVWGQRDGWPVDGLFPTSHFEVGELIEDLREVPALPGAPPGEYDLVVGLYRLETMQRLDISGSDAVRPDRALVLLPKVRITNN